VKIYAINNYDLECIFKQSLPHPSIENHFQLVQQARYDFHSAASQSF